MELKDIDFSILIKVGKVQVKALINIGVVQSYISRKIIRRARIVIEDKKQLYPLVIVNRGDILGKGFIIKTTVPIKITI